MPSRLALLKSFQQEDRKTVIVFDFIGSDKTFTALGQKIADDFSEASQEISACLSSIRSQITQAFDKSTFHHRSFAKPELELWLAKKLGQG